MSRLQWYSSIVVIGATAIAVEITGLRFLAPLFGSSLPIWGLAIATVLVGLAWGYTKGGQRAEEGHAHTEIFYASALGAVLFLWMPIAFFSATALRSAAFTDEHPSYLVSAFLIAYAALLIPSLVFGMVSPLAVQVETVHTAETAGHVAGRISMLMTIGSLLGIVIPSFITIPFLGSTLTVLIFAGITLAVSLPYSTPDGKLPWSLMIAAVVAVAALVAIRSQDSDLLFARETAHQYVTVRQVGDERLLAFDGTFGTQSLYSDKVHTNGYWDYLAALPIFLPESNRELSVLVLGAAASTTERQLDRFWQGVKKFHFTSVELDGELFKIAETYFNPPSRQKVTADARSFVTTTKTMYDLVVIDVYTRELSVPFHMVTSEFFGQLKKRVSDQGIVAVNINAVSTETLWLRSIARTLHAHFAQVQLVRVPESCNYLLLASRTPLTYEQSEVPRAVTPLLPALQATTTPRADGLLLRDDKSPTDLLGLAALLATPQNPEC